MNQEALFDSVIVKEIEEKQKGNIIIPDMNKTKIIKVKIISVGPGRMSVMGKLIPPLVEVGWEVTINKAQFSEIKEDGKTYLVGVENQIKTKCK